MITELVCPDCGGVVGATETTEAGPPCTCFVRPASRLSSQSVSMSGTLSGVAVDGLDPSAGDASTADVFEPTTADPQPGEVPAVVQPGLKVCRVCGKDLNGHRRVRDGGGYLCVPCAKEDEKRENYGRVRCRVCGHLTLEDKLTDYEGTKMCPNCHEQRTVMRQTEMKRIGFAGARVRDELHHIYILLAIGGGLMFMILLGVLINHYRH